VLIAAQPVRGLDVRATDFVYRLLEEHRQAGVGILLISMDLDEVMALSDRVAVMAHGRIRGVLERDQLSRSAIGALMTSDAAA
jgi:simple sugar transport system ATP-binding protein